MNRTAFQCTVCFDDKVECFPHYAGEHPVCIECTRETLVPQFEQALKYEHFYPVKFGDVVLNIDNFRDVLHEEFRESFRVREEEYKTKVSDRLYCTHHVVSRGEGEEVLNVLDVVLTPSTRIQKCNAFVGSKTTFGFVYCGQCTGLLCTHCEEPLTDSDQVSTHICKAPTQEDNSANFDGLQKGVAWQQCPHCEIKVELKEACNEMVCACGGRFCFVCGIALPAEGAGDHFASTCPRWGPAATATTANYDYIPPPRVATEGQIAEAVGIAMLSEARNPHPRSAERIVVAIMDRDLLRSTADALQQAWLAQDDESTWRFNTAALLYRFADIVQLILEATQSEEAALFQLSEDFHTIMSEIGDPFPEPPQEFLMAHREVDRLLTRMWNSQDSIYFYIRGFPNVEDMEVDVDAGLEAGVAFPESEAPDSDHEMDTDTESAAGEDA